MLMAAVSVCFHQVRQYRERLRHFDDWPKVNATVLRYDRRYGGGSYSPGTLNRYYRYELNGRQVTGRGPDILQRFGVHDLPEGSAVELAHDPGNPEDVLTHSDAWHVPHRVETPLEMLLVGLVGLVGLTSLVRRD